ncbi:MAG: methyltransferase domain-containing protein [bacterium]|nr:methyltransferase domain-containing protein [bacterium]
MTLDELSSRSDETLALPFDQYQRYRLVADLVERLRAGRGALRILDVGGRTALLRSFLPDDNVHLVDVEPSDVDGLVLGDGGRLPFVSNAFDVVAAFDTLEHVPVQYREAFVAECARVCRGHVMIAGPYAAPRVDEAEELLKSFMLEKLDLRHRYLEEHREYGLPDRERVEAQLTGLGGRVRSYGHANLDRWLVLMCMEMYLDHDPVLRPLGERFFRFYNAALYASDHAEPVYRHVVLSAFDGSEPPSVEGLLDPPVAPEGALRTLTDFGVELLAVDREKDVWRPELKRLEAVVAGLEKDLSEHKDAMATAERDLDEHKATVAKLRGEREQAEREQVEVRAGLEADLREHQGSLADERTAREAAVEARKLALDELAAEAERAREVREALEADLAAHRGSLEETSRDLDEHRKVVASLTADLDAHRAHAGALEHDVQRITGEREATRAELEATEAQLAQARAALDAARADLRDRWDSLKRAFGPKRSF